MDITWLIQLFTLFKPSLILPQSHQLLAAGALS